MEPNPRVVIQAPLTELWDGSGVLEYKRGRALSGSDETFIGGKARNRHVAQRKRRITGTGGRDKTAVLGILERGGKVRPTVIEDQKKILQVSP